MLLGTQSITFFNLYNAFHVCLHMFTVARFDEKNDALCSLGMDQNLLWPAGRVIVLTSPINRRHCEAPMSLQIGTGFLG